MAELVSDVRERGLPVVRRSGTASASVRRDAAGLDGVAFAERPVRSERLRGMVTGALA